MRRVKQKVEDERAIHGLLAQAEVGRLATSGPDGPMIKPLNFIHIDNAIYFHSAMEGEKIDHIKVNPKVCFEVEGEMQYIPATEKPCKASYKYESIIISGSATIVDDQTTRIDVLNGLMKKYQPEGEYDKVTPRMAQTTAVIEIAIETMTMKSSPAQDN
ncbi:hypothetical protein MNBD_NITROSPINAE01-648 [hydrothermal vent metagenome]|uniref:Pyridoxamine 5'-phosphate oxidase-related, FMN-binding n=1 Tax=hydrothermal vent metagenome TaxID=652676 RepID=A0A3B1BNS7_9ZZZZ